MRSDVWKNHWPLTKNRLSRRVFPCFYCFPEGFFFFSILQWKSLLFLCRCAEVRQVDIDNLEVSGVTTEIWQWLEQPNHLALSIWLQDVRDFDIKMMSNKQNWDDGHAKHANVPSCVPLSPLCFPCSCAEWDPSDAERNSCAHRKDQWAKSGEFQIFLGSGRMIWRSDRTDGILTRHQSAWFFLFKVKLMIKRWKKCMKCTKFAFLLCCCFWQVILQLYPIGCAPRNLPDVVCQKLLWPFFEPIPGFKTGSIQATGPTIQPVGWWHSCELTGW